MELQPMPSFKYVQQCEERQAQKQRPVQACSECRRRKSKCDRKFPCGPCKLRGEQSICAEYVNPNSDFLTGYTDVRDFDALVQHIRDVERVMGTMIGTIQQLESRLAEFTTGRNGSGMQLAPLHIEAPPTSVSPRMVTDNGRPAASRRTTETFLQGDQNLLPPSPRAAPFAHNQDISGQRIDSSALRPCSMSRSPRPMAEDSRVVDHYVRPLWENSDMLRDVQSEEEEKREQTGNFAEVSRAPSLTDHHAALILEDLAFDRTSNVERQNPENNMDRDVLATRSLDATVRIEPLDKNGLSSMRIVTIPDLHVLPEILKTSRIMAFFFSDVEWLFRCVHVPSFKQRIQHFMSNPLFNPMTVKDAGFLSLYAACLCTSLHLMEPTRLLETGYTQESRDVATTHLSQLVMTCFSQGDMSQRHMLEFIQAYIIIGPYWNSCGRSERHWSLLGVIVKIAQNLGLSRLGPELSHEASVEHIKRAFGSRWEMAADREIGRRIWWTLTDAGIYPQDVQFAPEHHFTMITHSRMSHTALPAHIDDDRLVGSGPIMPAPMTEYNTMSYFLNRIEWTLPLRRLVEQMNELGTLRYSLIEEAHDKFMKRVDDEPAYFNIENPQYDACATDAMMLFNLRRERIALYLYGHLRILRVHRLYLAQSLRSEKYELSTRASLRAATFIIEHDWKATHGLPTRYWPLQYAALTATSALFHLYCHAKGQEEEKMLANLVSSGIKILK
ncbi:hypothetical protein QFC24_004884 [Naganishia onofrii]|uniref:Uncharacterized protein n=1 Tax=Naganishia onofrii TaxID=1851511 RepID=A0ACC2XB09_9TREE|nr:hypothetical protein QFC24_004884 [Naganishia onofrii]